MAWIIGVVIALVLGGLVVYALMNNREPEQPTTTNETTTTETQDADITTPPEEEDAVTEGTTITFSDSGFSPSSLSVKAGTEVTVKNESSKDVQFSSDDHPTHTEQNELNLAALAPGESATFTPSKVGTWGFHDHLSPDFTGVLEVTE